MAAAWFRWVEAKISRIEDEHRNLEETVKTLKRQRKRMLLIFIGVIILNDILLLSI